MNTLDSFIHVFPEAFEKKLCEDIITETNEANQWSSAGIGQSCESIKEWRKCESVNLKVCPDLDALAFQRITKLVKEYALSYYPYLDICTDSGYDVLRYGKGDYYVEHVDQGRGLFRTVSCVVCLNEDFQGGKLEFFSGEKVISLRQGDAILFPSNFSFPHRVTPVTEGQRYSLVTWLT